MRFRDVAIGAAVAASVAASFPSTAAADEAATRPRAAAAAAAPAAAAERYFADEDRCNGAYVGLGATLVATGVGLATRDDAGFEAAGYPVIAVGGIQIVVGALYLILTRGWQADAEAQLREGTGVFVQHQRERLESVEAGFKYYKITEATFALTGLGLGIAGAADATDDPEDNEVLLGVGVGLGLAACTQLIMEHTVHDVAKRYLRDLTALRVTF